MTIWVFKKVLVCHCKWYWKMFLRCFITVLSNEHKDEAFLHDLEEGDVWPIQPKAKMARKENQPRTIVESFHLNTMVKSYHQNFGIYFRNKKQVTQLILSLVWKTVYGEYKSQHILVRCSKRTHWTIVTKMH